MKKEKLFNIDLVNKSSVHIVKNATTFYTSDTELWLGFELLEKEHIFDSAEILLLNKDDRSFIVRSVTQGQDKYWYELESDIIAHYGEWVGQLQFTKGNEVFTSKPFSFKIENDLSNDRPPQLTDVNNWKNLRTIADDLISDLRTELESVIEQGLAIKTAEEERQSAELVRVENEKQRSLTTVDEFVKLQNAIGGRNMVGVTIPPFNPNRDGTGSWQRMSDDTGDFIRLTPSQDKSVSTFMSGSSIKYWEVTLPNETYNWSLEVRIPKANYVSLYNNKGRRFVDSENKWVRISSSDVESQPKKIVFGINYDQVGQHIDYRNLKLEKGTQTTPYTKAPEEYIEVSKDDYYEHVKLMTNFKNSQFDKLRKAVIALGGTI